MSLRFAVHNADGTFAHGGMTMCPNDADAYPLAAPYNERWATEVELRQCLNPGQRLTVGWDACVFCGAPLTDSVEHLSTRPYCTSACEEADAC